MNSVIQSLGWTLIHFVWQALVIAVLFALTASLLRNRGPNSRYVAASAAMLAMLASAVATFCVHNSPEPSKGLAYAELNRATPAGVLLVPAVDGSKGIPSATAAAPSPAVDYVSAAVEVARTTGLTATRMESLLPWLVLGWVAGVLLLSVRFFGGWSYTRYLIRFRARVASDRWCDELLTLCRRLRIDRRVHLLESAFVENPVVVGWLKPAILMPVGVLTGLSQQQVEAILIHELAHIRRHDYLANLLQTVVETLFFFHPAMWWVSRCMSAEREYCCDDIASANSRDTSTYVRALARLEENRGRVLVPALAASGGSLLNRIARLCGRDMTSGVALRPDIILLSVIVASLSLAVASFGLGIWSDDDDYQGDTEMILSSDGGQFSNDKGHEVNTSWSPDGEWIAYDADHDGNRDIWKKPVDGSRSIRLTDHRAADKNPVWSPDGSKLAFARRRGGAGEIWTMSASGGDQQKISTPRNAVSYHFAHGVEMSWSPDGRSLAYVCFTEGSSRVGGSRDDTDICVMPANGGESRQVITGPASENNPAWSPDGTLPVQQGRIRRHMGCHRRWPEPAADHHASGPRFRADLVS